MLGPAIYAIATAQLQILVAQEERQREARMAQLEREHEQWEDDNLLPLMTEAQRAAFIVERQRKKERREDIARELKLHSERMEVERRKASALENSSRRKFWSYL